MIRVNLPGVLELTCPACQASFTLHARLLNGKANLHCPLCAMEFSVYDCLSPLLRRRIYHAVRDSIERRVYEQQQMNRSDYLEDWGNLPTGSP